MAEVKVVTVPMLGDNYGYIVYSSSTPDQAAAVDAVEPSKVLAAAQKHNVTVTTLLTTHDHWDHGGGNSEFKKQVPDVVIYGGRGDAVPAVDHEVGDGDTITVGDLSVRVLATPGHTPGHVSYVVDGQGSAAGDVFTGDTLFIGGCGKFNKGTPEMMHDALCNKLGKLPGKTRVWVGHEYTAKNLLFASEVEGDNSRIQEKLAWAKSRTEANEPTVPSTIEDEWATNPFMRCGEAAVERYAGTKGAVETLATVRQRKNEWAGPK